MTGNLLLDGAIVILIGAGFLGLGKLFCFGEKAKAEDPEASNTGVMIQH